MPRGSHNCVLGQTGICAYKPCSREFPLRQPTQKFCCQNHRVYHHVDRRVIRTAMKFLEEKQLIEREQAAEILKRELGT